jgi:hypothetical protein
MRRVSSGNDADTSVTRKGGGVVDACGSGETFGKARPGFVTGVGSRGSEPAGGASGSRVPGGRGAPTPGVGVGDADGVGTAVTRTLPDADAEAGACGEVPVAVRVIWVPAAFCGTAIAACSSTGWAVRPTEHVFFPAGEQTVKLGASLAGFAVMLIFAWPLAWLASETQIA